MKPKYIKGKIIIQVDGKDYEVTGADLVYQCSACGALDCHVKLDNGMQAIFDLISNKKRNGRIIKAMAAAMVGEVCPPGQCDEMNRDCKECIETYYREQAEGK